MAWGLHSPTLLPMSHSCGEAGTVPLSVDEEHRAVAAGWSLWGSVVSGVAQTGEGS